jgi:hypothetical protein
LRFHSIDAASTRLALGRDPDAPGPKAAIAPFSSQNNAIECAGCTGAGCAEILAKRRRSDKQATWPISGLEVTFREELGTSAEIGYFRRKARSFNGADAMERDSFGNAIKATAAPIEAAAAITGRQVSSQSKPVVTNPGDLVARALKILAEETDAWQRRRAEGRLPGSRR